MGPDSFDRGCWDLASMYLWNRGGDASVEEMRRHDAMVQDLKLHIKSCVTQWDRAAGNPTLPTAS